MGELLDRLHSIVSSVEEVPEPPSPLTLPPGFQFQSTLVPVSPESYCVDGTVLRYTVASLAGGYDALLTYRILLPSGEVKGYSKTVTVTGLYLDDVVEEALPECVLLNAQVSATATIWRGECFARIELLGSYITNNDVVWSLAHGYLSAGAPLSWPNPRQESAEMPPGLMYRAAGTSPGAGNEISEPILETSKVVLLGIRFTFTTSAVAANRYVRLRVFDGSSFVYQSSSEYVQTASQSFSYRWYNEVVQSVMSTTALFAPLRKGVLVYGGWTVGTSTENMQAGDSFTNVSYVVESMKQL